MCVGGVRDPGGRLFFYLSLTLRRERVHTPEVPRPSRPSRSGLLLFILDALFARASPASYQSRSGGNARHHRRPNDRSSGRCAQGARATAECHDTCEGARRTRVPRRAARSLDKDKYPADSLLHIRKCSLVSWDVVERPQDRSITEKGFARRCLIATANRCNVRDDCSASEVPTRGGLGSFSRATTSTSTVFISPKTGSSLIGV